MQSFKDIGNIYENFFSDAEEDENSAPVSVQTLLEGEHLKEWQQIGFGCDAESKGDIRPNFSGA